MGMNWREVFRVPGHNKHMVKRILSTNATIIIRQRQGIFNHKVKIEITHISLQNCKTTHQVNRLEENLRCLYREHTKTKL
jgi:hypothetical protein